MDIYTFSLGLGATGLGFMAFAGVARHAGPDAAHAGGVHTAGAHAGGDAHGGLVGSHAHAPILHAPGSNASGPHAAIPHAAIPHAAIPHAAIPHAAIPHAAIPHGSSSVQAQLNALMSPRVLFGILLGLGTAGLVLRHTLGGALLFCAALIVGVAFERYFLSALWNFTLRFASRPALTLETAVAGEATAITTFDESGHGIVQVVVDGQVVQVLGTLTKRERALGHRVRPGETLRVEEVDARRASCRVSLL